MQQSIIPKILDGHGFLVKDYARDYTILNYKRNPYVNRKGLLNKANLCRTSYRVCS